MKPSHSDAAPAELFLHFHEDPGHGWLAAPSSFLREFDIADQVSAFSYLSRDGRTVYLEEDCDAGTFVRAAERHGFRVVTEARYSPGSFIRNLPHYAAAFVPALPAPDALADRVHDIITNQRESGCFE